MTMSRYLKTIFSVFCAIGTIFTPSRLSAATPDLQSADYCIRISQTSALTALILLCILPIAVLLLRRTLIGLCLPPPFSFAVLNARGGIRTSKLTDSFSEQFADTPGELEELPAELAARFKTAITAVFRSGKPETVEYQAAGKYYKAEFFRSRPNLFSRRMVGWFAYGIDEYKRGEQRYKETSTMLQVILDNLPGAIFVKNVDDGLRYVLSNNTHAALCEAGHNEIIGSDDYQLFPYGDTAEQCRRNDLATIDSPEQFFDGVEPVFVTPDRIVICRSIKTVIHEESGRRLLLGLSLDITHQEQTERELAKTSRMLQSIMNHLPCALFAKAIDDDCRYVLSNSVHAGFCGRPPEEIIGHTEEEVFASPGDAEQFRKNDLEILDSPGQSFDGTEWVIDANGNKALFHSIKTIITEEDGRRLLLGISIDITRQEEMERELAKNSRLLRAIMDNLPCALFVKDPANNYEYLMANRVYAEIMHTPEDEIIGKNDYDIFPTPEAAAGCRASDTEAVASGEQVDVKEVITGDDGKLYAYRCIKGAFDYDGDRSLLLGVIMDITRQEETERELSNANRLMQTIMDNLPCALFVKDPDRDYSYIMANRMFAGFVNFKIEDIPGKTDRDLFILPENAAGCRATDQAAVDSGTLLDCKETVMAGDRTFYTLRCIKDTVNYDDGQRYLLGICVDITRQEEAERELIKALAAAESASKAKSFFLATVSHELRTPLNAVIGFSELLKRGGIAPEESKECVESISIAGNALLNLINDVLDLSKIEADQMEIAPQTIDTSALLAEIKAIFSNKAAEKQLQLIIDAPAKLPPMQLDSLRLRQILLNVVGNALKFTRNGFVKIKVEFNPYDNNDGKGELIIEVIDSGVGISAEFQKRLFTPFAQQRTSDDKFNREGTGLGLAITKRLIDKIGGSISAESEPGKGCRFVITLENISYGGELPKAKPEVQADLKLPEAGLDVLIVDDIPINLKVLASMLKQLQIVCRSAESGREALEQIERKTPDLVLTDMWMPEMNGDELALRIRTDERCKNVRIIAVTADSEARGGEHADRFDEILLKPVTLDKLRRIFT